MQKRRRLGRGVAIVGAAMSQFGTFRDKDSRDLFVDAYGEMLSSVDKGIDPKDIDAVYVGNYSNDFFVHQAHWGPIISDLIGHIPKPATRTEGACASSARNVPVQNVPSTQPAATPQGVQSVNQLNALQG